MVKEGETARGRATAEMVARRANVSRVAVSRAFNAHTSLKPENEIATLGERPVLLINSAEDTLDDFVPVEQMHRLERAAAGNPNLHSWAAPGRGHVQAYRNNPDEYMSQVLAFFGDYLK